jgi:glycosyltransferase involved in cell wall biosynthesis
MSGRPFDVSIIVPTMACRERAASLFRAIDTILSQQGARGIPLVVVNGDSAAPEVLEHLRRRADIRLTIREEASLPRALHAGRALVDTPYFAVLDDDDQLLPGALRTRLELLTSASGADVAVTSGFFERSGRREVNIADFRRIQADPLRMLLVQHWLPPCAGLFRTSAVTVDFFEAIPRYREWTYLAIRLALGLRITFAARPTFVYCFDTPDSLSKSRAYCLGGPSALARMLELELPADVRAALRVRLAGDLHSASVTELEDGNYRAAWRWHLKSLAQPSGWRYLPHARHLLIGSLSRRVAGGRTRAPGSA